MSLELTEPGRYALKGIVTFDNAAVVEENGRRMIENDLQQGESRLEVNLAGLLQGDSSTLSVCLSWLRLARQYNASFCLSGIPGELQALAKVCGVESLLDESACSL